MNALRLARRESIRATRISGRIYLDRGDLDVLAARNTIAPTSDSEVDDDNDDGGRADLLGLARFAPRSSRR